MKRICGAVIALLRPSCRGQRMVPFRPPSVDEIPIRLSEGRSITDPDEAEALGLTADAARMRREQQSRPWGTVT